MFRVPVRVWSLSGEWLCGAVAGSAEWAGGVGLEAGVL